RVDVRGVLPGGNVRLDDGAKRRWVEQCQLRIACASDPDASTVRDDHRARAFAGQTLVTDDSQGSSIELEHVLPAIAGEPRPVRANPYCAGGVGEMQWLTQCRE